MRSEGSRVRVLIVDDSPFNRRTIATSFRAGGDIEVVGMAADGNEAIRLVHDLKPDVITLDLEMPRMDGFSFLRILAGTRPTPVIVVSGYSQRENVFRALELGAVDFVAKPDVSSAEDVVTTLELLKGKVLALKTAVRPGVKIRAPSLRPRPRLPSLVDAPKLTPRYLIAVAASTGGPSTLTELFSQLSPRGSYAVLVAQHMPENFTRTFAERLDRQSAFTVSEARDNDQVVTQSAFVCPGRQCMEVVRTPGGAYRLRIVPPGDADRYVPSGNRLFQSVAEVAGPRAVGVILTGMGDDGVEGARAILHAGGMVIAESEDSAVIYGMPGAAARAGVVTKSLHLQHIADYLQALVF